MKKPILQLIAKDFQRDRESWSWMAVIHFTGELAMDPEMAHIVSDEHIRIPSANP